MRNSPPRTTFSRDPTGLDENGLAEIVKRLVAALSPRSIYLFGSQLYGTPTLDSDIDIMVILEEEPTTIEHHQQGYACLRGLGLPVELHISSRSRHERFAEVIGSLQHEIHRKGKTDLCCRSLNWCRNGCGLPEWNWKSPGTSSITPKAGRTRPTAENDE